MVLQYCQTHCYWNLSIGISGLSEFTYLFSGKYFLTVRGVRGPIYIEVWNLIPISDPTPKTYDESSKHYKCCVCRPKSWRNPSSYSPICHCHSLRLLSFPSHPPECKRVADPKSCPLFHQKWLLWRSILGTRWCTCLPFPHHFQLQCQLFHLLLHVYHISQNSTRQYQKGKMATEKVWNISNYKREQRLKSFKI